jgi:hypothetical protein
MLQRVAPVITDVLEQRTASIVRVRKFFETEKTLAVTSYRSMLRRNTNKLEYHTCHFFLVLLGLLVTANTVLSSPVLVTILMDAIHSSETSVLRRVTQHNISGDSILHYQKQTNSVFLSPRANYTDWSTATCRRNFVSTFVDRGVSGGQRGGSPTVVNLSFLDRSRYFSFK